MFVKLNNRVYLNTDRITRAKVADKAGEIRIHFYEGLHVVAKSKKFKSVEKAMEWIEKNLKAPSN